MIEINGFYVEESKVIALNNETIIRTVDAAIATIKKELPEEAQTVEVMELIIEEMKTSIKASRVLL